MQMMTNFRTWLIFGMLTPVFAEDIACGNPVEAIEGNVTEMLSILKASCKKGALRQNVESSILESFIPTVDTALITKQVLGRQYWRTTSDDDKVRLQLQIERLLAKQYSEAFNCNYLDNKMVFHPLRGEVKQYSRVDSNISLNDKTSILLRYAVRCQEEQWKIYDIVIDGLSLAQTYRSQFNRILQQGGAGALIQYLERKLTQDPDELQD